MDKYIEHLLIDLAKAAKKTSDQPKADLDSEAGFMEYMKQIEEVPKASFSDFLGIDPDIFPPVERLTEGQQETLLNAILKLWESYGMFAEFPDGLPLDRQYKLVIDSMKDQDTGYMTGNYHFDWCSGTPDGCALEEYCPCIKIWEEEDSKSASDDN